MILTENTLNRDAYFVNATEEINTLKDRNCVDLFDQNDTT